MTVTTRMDTVVSSKGSNRVFGINRFTSGQTSRDNHTKIRIRALSRGPRMMRAGQDRAWHGRSGMVDIIRHGLHAMLGRATAANGRVFTVLDLAYGGI